MTNDWQRLGAVVHGIVERLEGVMRDRPPVPAADAALFVLMLAEVYGPPVSRAVALRRQEPEQAGDGE